MAQVEVTDLEIALGLLPFLSPFAADLAMSRRHCHRLCPLPCADSGDFLDCVTLTDDHALAAKLAESGQEDSATADSGRSVCGA